MEGLTVNRQELARAFDVSLFSDFVAWIDRSEKTTRCYLCNLRQFAAWLKYAEIAHPAREDILSYRQWLTSEHDAIRLDPESMTGWSYRTGAAGEPLRIKCAPNTTALYLRSVCQFFKWAAAAGLYPDIAANIHAPKVKHDTHRKEALTASEVLEIEQSIERRARERIQSAQEAQKDSLGRTQRSTEQGKRLCAMYLLAVNAGLRTIEISRANVRDFVTKGGQAWIYIWGKGHAEPDQRKPLAPEVAAAILDYLAARADKPTGASPLFVSTGNRSGGRRIASTTISTLLKRAMQEAGYNSERLTAHSLRHSCGTSIMEVTGSLYAAQAYMRHANPATTEIYLHNSTEEAEAAIARDLYNLYHGTGTRGSRAQLDAILDSMTPEQLEQITGIAAAIKKK